MDSFQSIFSSQPFRFTVGLEKREFVIHAAVLVNQSAALKKLITGPFKEAQTHHVVLDHVDEATFEFFAQYLYTGDYQIITGKPVVQSGSEDVQVSEEQRQDGFFATNKKKKKKPFAKDLDDCDDTDTIQGQIQPGELEQALTCHSRVYMLAHYYDVETLMGLSIQKIRALLAEGEVNETSREGIVRFLGLCLEDDPPDQLRSFVSLYAASRVDKLWESQEFQGLLATHGELSREIIGLMLDTQREQDTQGHMGYVDDFY